MVRLVINADDFGLNEGRTRAILEFFERGLVSNTTLMVNMPFAEEAVELAKASGVSDRVGLHLNLTEGTPISDDIKGCKWLCSDEGQFNMFFHLSVARRFIIPNHFVAPLREEIGAQIARYLEFGLGEMHFDSHHHSHTDYVVAKELFPLAEKAGFRTARLSANLGSFGIVKRLYKNIYNKLLSSKFSHADFFGGMGSVEKHWHKLNGHTVEVMVHPIRCASGFACDEPADVGEYETTADELSGFLARHKGEYELVSYIDL